MHGCAGGGGLVGGLRVGDTLISNGLGDEEHVSKAKFAGSPDSNSPCNVGRGEGLCVVVNENLRANLRAFFLVMASESMFFFFGGRLPPGPLFIVPVLLGMSSTAVLVHIYQRQSSVIASLTCKK